MFEPLTLGEPPALSPRGAVARLRDSHHAVARLTAEGRNPAEISALSGYSPSHLWKIRRDPGFIELVNHYRAEARAACANMMDRMETLGMDTVAELQERLAESPESFTNEELQSQLKLLADRTGFAPVRQTNVNVTVGLAERLEAARLRVIEHQAPLGAEARENE
jgi:hypothetical protein